VFDRTIAVKQNGFCFVSVISAAFQRDSIIAYRMAYIMHLKGINHILQLCLQTTGRKLNWMMWAAD